MSESIAMAFSDPSLIREFSGAQINIHTISWGGWSLPEHQRHRIR
jgi:hypothetical protein